MDWRALFMAASQMSYKSLKPSFFWKVKYQQQHITQDQKFIVIPLDDTDETTGCTVSTDPITISKGSVFCFGKDYHSVIVVCVHPPAPSVTNTELLSASGSSPFRANKFIHPVMCYLVLHRRVVLKKGCELETCIMPSPLRPGWVTYWKGKQRQ